jgi:hypothetical protein
VPGVFVQSRAGAEDVRITIRGFGARGNGSNVSALYGNASGGVVDLQSTLDFNSPFIELRERAGSFGYHREQGRAGFTMGQARGTGMIVNSTYDGWREHSSSSATKAKVVIGSPVGEETRIRIGLDAVSDLIRFPGPLIRAQADVVSLGPEPQPLCGARRRGGDARVQRDRPAGPL